MPTCRRGRQGGLGRGPRGDHLACGEEALCALGGGPASRVGEDRRALRRRARLPHPEGHLRDQADAPQGPREGLGLPCRSHRRRRRPHGAARPQAIRPARRPLGRKPGGEAREVQGEDTEEDGEGSGEGCGRHCRHIGHAPGASYLPLDRHDALRQPRPGQDGRNHQSGASGAGIDHLIIISLG